MATEHGHLIIADISGYTEFTIQSEIDHAEGIMKGLLGTIVESIQPPFIVSKLEGDAVFARIPANSFCQGQSLIEALETVYFRFRDLLFQMRKNTTCPCNACINMRKLDLKMVVHHGQYAVSEIAGGTELSGPDVIAVHRLLKNSVREKTGFAAYCFLTDVAAAALGPDDPTSDGVRHGESLDQIGTIEGYVFSLEQAWQTYSEQRVVRVDPASAYLIVSEIIPLSQAATWDFMHDDENWVVWSRTSEPPDFRKPASGRNGVGLQKHCVHGRDTIAHTIVDWRPFDYYSTDLLINSKINCRHTISLEPVEGGTRVSFVSQAPDSESLVPRLFMRLMGKKLRQKIEADFRACLTKLKEIVEAEIEAGRPTSA